MSILKVARMGHPVLRERARPVEAAELKHPLFQKLNDDMIETMHEYHGVGLAAPQVHEDIRVFVGLLDEDPSPKTEAIALINPEITPEGSDKQEGWEGCLSIPDIRGMVPRFTSIVVKALDRDGRGEGDALVFINPEITVKGDQIVEGWDGCLSIPDIRGRVPRAQHISVTALDRSGQRVELAL